jgi:hypothetical protein
MITSKQIIETLSNPSELEIIQTVMHNLHEWLFYGHTSGINQSIFSFFKKHVPKCVYSGKAYRVMWIDDNFFLDSNIVSSEDELENLKTKQVRRVLQLKKSHLSKTSSWSKSLDGIEAAKSALGHTEVGVVCILISDQIVGIDVEVVIDFLEKKIKEIDDNPSSTGEQDKLFALYYVEFGEGSEARDMAENQEEVIAPFNINSFQVVTSEHISY